MLTMGSLSATTKAATGDIKIDATNFPDVQVRRSLCSKNIDKNKDGILSRKEINSCTILSLDGTKEVPIRTLKGIEKLNLGGILEFNTKYLKCDYMSLVSKMTKLQDLSLGRIQNEVNDLSKLHIKKFHSYNQESNVLKQVILPKSLEELYIDSQSVEEIKIDGTCNVKEMSLGSAFKLKKLDFSKMPKLEYVSANYLSKDLCNFRANTKLKEFGVRSDFTKLDLSQNKKLERIDIWGCGRLKQVVFPKNSAKAQELSVRIRFSNQWSKANFNDAKNLVDIEIPDNGFTKFSASKLKRLKYLDVNGSKKLKIISVVGNTKLQAVYAKKCPITKLVLWKNKKLQKVKTTDCKKLKTLYLPKGKKVKVWKYKKTKIKWVR